MLGTAGVAHGAGVGDEVEVEGVVDLGRDEGLEQPVGPLTRGAVRDQTQSPGQPVDVGTAPAAAANHAACWDRTKPPAEHPGAFPQPVSLTGAQGSIVSAASSRTADPLAWSSAGSGAPRPAPRSRPPMRSPMRGRTAGVQPSTKRRSHVNLAKSLDSDPGRHSGSVLNFLGQHRHCRQFYTYWIAIDLPPICRSNSFKCLWVNPFA